MGTQKFARGQCVGYTHRGRLRALEGLMALEGREAGDQIDCLNDRLMSGYTEARGYLCQHSTLHTDCVPNSTGTRV